MLKLRQAIVVEGRYDKNKLKQLVDTEIFETRGFGVLNDRALLELLRRAAEKRGLIILTDSDGAGFVIRNYLKGALPKDRVAHAYIPDVFGKERRKTAPGREGKLGVEGMPAQVLIKALEQAGAQFDDAPRERLTKYDLYALGLSGTADCAGKRAALLRRLELPEHLSANALLDVLNLLYSREEALQMLQETEETTNI